VNKVLRFVEKVAGMAEKTKLNQALSYKKCRKIPTVAKTRWDSLRDQVKAIADGYSVIVTYEAVQTKLRDCEVPNVEDIKGLLLELDYFVSKRKIFEKAGPTGHLVYPIYVKLKRRSQLARSDVGKQFAKAVEAVIDFKMGKGTGRRTCLGGIISDLHLLQTYLNPMYKHLPDLDPRNVTWTHELVDKLIAGIAQEFPHLPLDHEVKSEQSGDDSDDGLLQHSFESNAVPERIRWLKLEHGNPKKYRLDSTAFWENEGREKFPCHALLYYRLATKHPSEAWAERFFSLAGYITSNRRVRMGIDVCRATVMRSMWQE